MLDEPKIPLSGPEYAGLHSLSFRAMGSSFDMWLAAESDGDARAALSDAKAFIEDAEQLMSRFREDSELSALNRYAGGKKAVDPALFEVVSIAVEAAAESAGIYDPTVLPALMAAGYDRSFEKIRTEADSETNPEPKLVAGQSWRSIDLDSTDDSITLHRGVQIDLGGVGKAWTAHRAADLLFQTGPCIVSAGGDVSVRGEAYPGEGWLVAINDPFNLGEPIATFEVATCGIATSGIDRRKWTRSGKSAHHLIDPRTGQPAVTDLISVTVMASDVLVAERLALTSMVIGSEQASKLLENERGVEGLLVFASGQHFSTSGIHSFLVPAGGAE